MIVRGEVDRHGKIVYCRTEKKGAITDRGELEVKHVFSFGRTLPPGYFLTRVNEENNQELKNGIARLEEILEQLKGYHRLDEAILKINNVYDSGVFDVYQRMKEDYMKKSKPVERIEFEATEKTFE